jgi:phage tail sheath gpL-like
MTLAANHRVPGTFIDVQVQEQGPTAGALAFRRLIIGQRITGQGTGTNDTATRVRSADEVGALAARGSMVHRQAIPSFSRNRTTETWVALLADPAGAAATGTIVVSGPATASGEISLYVGGNRLAIPVVDTAISDDIASDINDAINNEPDLPITATVLASTVTWTYRHIGEVGNDYDVRHSYADGEQLPASVGLVITPALNGTGAPSLTALFAAIAAQEFHVITHPYTDAPTLTAIENELDDRASQLRQIPGVGITSAQGSVGTLTALGTARNSEHHSIVAQPGNNPLTPPSEFAAEVAAVIAEKGAIQPTIGWNTEPLPHSVSPAMADRFQVFPERNDLLNDGIATAKVGADGRQQIERIISTYQTNASGAPDTTYLDLTTALTLIHLRTNWRTFWDSNYSDYALAADGTRVKPGVKLMTPSKARGISITWARTQESAGLIQNLDAFVDAVTAAIDPGDSTRMNVVLPPKLISPLYVNDTTLSFTR